MPIPDGASEQVVQIPFNDDTDDATEVLSYRLTSDNGLNKNSNNRDRPTAVLFHGLGGRNTSRYLQLARNSLLRAGYNVACPNFRGAGTSGPLACEFHHPGRSQDIRPILEGIANHPEIARGQNLVTIGFSLGGHVMLKALADGLNDLPIMAAIAVSAPLSLSDASKSLSRLQNLPIGCYLLRRLRAEVTRSNGHVSDEALARALSAKTIWQLDDRFTGPRYGFDGAADYYAAESAVKTLQKIETPTVCIHSQDDPFVPPDAYETDAFKENQNLYLIMQRHGGHAGFFQQLWSKRWIDETLVRLVDERFWERHQRG